MWTGNCLAGNGGIRMVWPTTATEVTSPFGWRVHPVFGTQKFHSGIDIGSDFNDPIWAAADGVIEFADWAGGYGNLVIIDHGEGVRSYYAHNNTIAPGVVAGVNVKQGNVVAYCGSTGYSTGPHLHFEVQLNGTAVTPVDYLDGSIPMPDASSLAIGPDGVTFMNSDFDEVNLDLDSYYDFAKPLREAIETFSKQCTLGIQLVQGEVKWLFFALITIDLALATTFKLFEGDWKPIQWLMKRLFKYGFILFLIIHWGDMVANSVKDYFVYMGSTAAGADSDKAGLLMSDPTFIVQKGAYVVSPAFSYIQNLSGVKIIYNLPNIIMAVISAIAILICFFVIGFQIMLAYLEFYIIASLSVVTLGFGGLKQTKFLADKGVGALIAVSIKLMIYSFLAILLDETVKDFGNQSYDLFDYLKIFLGSIAFVILGDRVTKTAGKLLSGGTPKF